MLASFVVVVALSVLRCSRAHTCCFESGYCLGWAVRWCWCTCVHICVHVYVHVYGHACMRICVYVHVCMRVCVYVHVWMCTCVFVVVHAYMYLCSYVLCLGTGTTMRALLVSNTHCLQC